MAGLTEVTRSPTSPDYVPFLPFSLGHLPSLRPPAFSGSGASPFSIRPPSSLSSFLARSIEFDSRCAPSGCRAVPPVHPPPSLRTGCRLRSRGACRALVTGVRSAAETPDSASSSHSAEPRRVRDQPLRASSGITIGELQWPHSAQYVVALRRVLLRQYHFCRPSAIGNASGRRPRYFCYPLHGGRSHALVG